MEKPLFVLASCHMDREWYLPMDATRVFFSRILDRALELLDRMPDFRFYTDGQTSVVLDYLETRPEQLPLLRKYIAEGRLAIGPWHVQSDERIPCGESLVRNLLLGKKDCAFLAGDAVNDRSGHYLPVGYLPDDFGHISQTPQLLGQFGLKNAFLMRGTDGGKAGREFFWRSPDGSRVFCITAAYGDATFMDLSNGLHDGIRMFSTPAQLSEKLEKALHAENEVEPYGLMLINSDCHILPENLAELGAERFDRWEDVFAVAAKAQDRCATLTGELSAGEDIIVLQDTLSSRIDLKTRNVRVQSLLGAIAEPLVCMTEPTPCNKGLLELGWKLLVENHTHDGITGCHADATHDDLINRFSRCESLALQLQRSAFEILETRLDTAFAAPNPVLVFTPHPAEEYFTVPFSIRVEKDRAVGRYFHLFTRQGTELPLLVTDRRPVGDIRSDRSAQQKFRHLIQFTGIVRLNPRTGTGLEVLRTVCDDVAPAYSGLIATDSVAENNCIRLKFIHGRLQLTDKRTGKITEDLFTFTDTPNSGDSYHFEACGEERPLPLTGIQLLNANGSFARYLLQSEDISCILTVCADSPLLRFSARIHNRTRDHGIRGLIRTGICGGVPFRDQPYVLEKGKTGVQPSSSFAGFTAPDGTGLALLHKGLHRTEYDTEGNLRVMLMQAQGRLYGWAFPDDPNPEYDGCEMLFPITLEYAILPLTGNENLFDRAACFVDEAAFWVCEQTAPCGQNLPQQITWLQIENAQQTAVKISEDGTRLVAHLFNPTDGSVTTKITLPSGAKHPVRMRLDETVLSPAEPSAFPMAAGEIAAIGWDL